MRNIEVRYDMKKIWARIEKRLDDDYRDPRPAPLPSRPTIHKTSLCVRNKKEDDSANEVISDSPVWDALLGMDMLRQKEIKTYTDFRNIQRQFIFNNKKLSKWGRKRLLLPTKKYVLLKLRRDGYLFAACYLKKLMNKHDEILAPIPPELKDKPIKNKPKTISFLGKILKQANIYKQKCKVEKELSLYFHTIRHYEIKDNYWSWLVYEFYKLAARRVKNFIEDGGYSKALINYMFGRYLLIKAKNAKHARRRLQIAFELSDGKPWGAMWATNVSFEKISEYSSYLLHIAQLLAANQIKNVKPDKALMYVLQAVRHARRGNWHPDLEEAMLDLVVMFSLNNKHDEAISVLVHLLKKVEPCKQREMYISIQVILTLCYKRAGRQNAAIRQLTNLIRLGREWEVPKIEAFGHKHIAIYNLLEKDKMIECRKHLESCIILNKKLKNYNELIESLYLYGYSQANQHLKEYVELMFEAKTPDLPGYKKIHEFLLNGKPFWKEKKVDNFVLRETVEPLLSKDTTSAYDNDEAKQGQYPQVCSEAGYSSNNPTECKLFKTKNEAEENVIIVANEHRENNEILEKLPGKCICFEIEKREVEGKSDKTEYIRDPDKIDPIIPYEKDSLMYKQALENLQNYLHPPKIIKSKPVYIDITSPKILIRLLNTIAVPSNVVFRFKGEINFKEILNEILHQRNQRKQFVESLPDLLELRFEDSSNYKLPKL